MPFLFSNPYEQQGFRANEMETIPKNYLQLLLCANSYLVGFIFPSYRLLVPVFKRGITHVKAVMQRDNWIHLLARIATNDTFVALPAGFYFYHLKKMKLSSKIVQRSIAR